MWTVIFIAVFTLRRYVFRTLSRSSRPYVFCKKGALTNFAKFTGNHLFKSLFFNKVAGLRPAILLKKKLCNFIKKETLTQLFSYEFCEICKTILLHRTPLVATSVSDNKLISFFYFFSKILFNSELKTVQLSQSLGILLLSVGPLNLN